MKIHELEDEGLRISWEISSTYLLLVPVLLWSLLRLLLLLLHLLRRRRRQQQQQRFGHGRASAMPAAAAAADTVEFLAFFAGVLAAFLLLACGCLCSFCTASFKSWP